MTTTLGINAVFHDPAAALVVDGQVVAAAEEERFSRRKHGKRPAPFSAWELPAGSAAWRLRRAVLVCDGRGERASHLASRYRDGRLEVLASHLGFARSSDECKVMALASYGRPRHAEELRAAVHAAGDGGFRTEPLDWGGLVKPRAPGERLATEHADLAAGVTEETLLELAGWLESAAWPYERPADLADAVAARRRTSAGGPRCRNWPRSWPARKWWWRPTPGRRIWRRR